MLTNHIDKLEELLQIRQECVDSIRELKRKQIEVEYHIKSEVMANNMVECIRIDYTRVQRSL